MERKEEKPLPAKPEGMTPEREERWDTFHLARIERRQRRAQNRQRAEEWASGKKSRPHVFGATKSNADLRAMAYNHLIDGNPVIAAIINELLSRRHKMGKLYALAIKHKHTLYGIEYDERKERGRKAKRKAIESGADDVRQLRRLAKQVREREMIAKREMPDNVKQALKEWSEKLKQVRERDDARQDSDS